MKFKNRTFLYIVTVLLGLVVVAFIATTSVAAPLPTTFASPMMPPVDLGGIMVWLAALGVLPVVPIVIEILKRFKLVPDGMAAQYSTIGSVILFIILFGLGVFGIDVSGDAAKDVYQVLIQFGTLVLMIVGSPLTYKLARWLGIVKPLASRA